MDMTIAQSTPKQSFFRTWRRELIRGGVLFTLVVGIGLFIRNFKHDMPTPWGVLGSFGDFDWGDGDGDRGGSLFGGGREIGDPWEFRTQLKSEQIVWIRNTNGPIDVVPSESDWLEITAEKSWRRSSPGSVEMVAVPSARGVTICALWEGRERRCGEDGDYRLNGVRKNDVAVRFTVHLPRGTPVDASTVNGPLEIVGVASPVEATTVNGRVLVNTASGSVKATTVNGSIEAIMHALDGAGDIDLTTVNGSVSAGLPARINVTIDAQTVNGRVETDFPVKISGKISTRHLRGTIGNGGQLLRLNTVNGSINIHEAGPEHQHLPTPRPTPSVQRPRAPRAPAVAPAAPVTPTPPPSH